MLARLAPGVCVCAVGTGLLVLVLALLSACSFAGGSSIKQRVCVSTWQHKGQARVRQVAFVVVGWVVLLAQNVPPVIQLECARESWSAAATAALVSSDPRVVPAGRGLHIVLVAEQCHALECDRWAADGGLRAQAHTACPGSDTCCTVVGRWPWCDGSCLHDAHLTSWQDDECASIQLWCACLQGALIPLVCVCVCKLAAAHLTAATEPAAAYLLTC
jgi:hypothetical protein